MFTRGLRVGGMSLDFDLVNPFAMEEVEGALKSMKMDTAPGLCRFGPILQGVLQRQVVNRSFFKEMLDDMAAKKVDMGRLNYGLITLTHKIKDEDAIEHYWPICLLNVILKIITKVLNKIIHPDQTIFILGVTSFRAWWCFAK
jgi:hypothetical protein